MDTEDLSIITEHVLLVDDEPSLRTAIEQFLKDRGCDVLTAGTAEKAIELLKSTNFGVAIVDIRLPGIDGLQLMAQIKEASQDTEVIIITAHASMDVTIKAIKHGAYDFLIKPFNDLEEIWLAVERALEKKRLTAKNIQLVGQLEDQNKKLTAAVRRLKSLIDTGREMSTFTSIRGLFGFLIDLIVAELGVKRTSLMLVSEDGKELRIAVAYGLKNDVIKSVRVKMGDGVAGKVARSGNPFLLHGENMGMEMDSSDTGLYAESFPIALSVPIKHRERIMGVINVTNRTSGESFTEGDISYLLGLAGLTGVAIESVKKYEDLGTGFDALA
ncbi:MAG: response regulator [Thermodesulfovibrionales bacterium]